MGIGLAVAVAGALGTLARFAAHTYVVRRAGAPVPAGTFAVNVAGSLALGFVVARYPGHDWVRLVVGLGFLGAFTTFSTLAFETVRLVEGRALGLALAYPAGSVVAGLVAVQAGMLLARL